MKTIVSAANYEFSFTDQDIANPDDLEYEINGNRGECSLWLLHDHGFTICVVCADTLQDALDIAVDENKMDRYLIQEEGNTPGTKGLPASDYPTLGTEDEEGITRLGNASEPFDIETLGYVKFPLPKLSLVRLCGEKIEASEFHV